MIPGNFKTLDLPVNSINSRFLNTSVRSVGSCFKLSITYVRCDENGEDAVEEEDIADFLDDSETF